MAMNSFAVKYNSDTHSFEDYRTLNVAGNDIIESFEKVYGNDDHEDKNGIVKGPKSLKFDHTPEEMAKLTDEIIERGTKVVDDLVAIPAEEKTYWNTILPLATFESDFSTLSSNIRFYRYVSPNKEQAAKSIELE